MKRLFSLTLAAIAIPGAYAQVEMPDSIAKGGDIPPIVFPSVNDGTPEHTDTIRTGPYNNPAASYTPAVADFSNQYPGALQPFSVSVPTDGRIVNWQSGGLFGDASAISMPGLMRIESGSLIFIQQLGRFTFTAHGDAVKYGYFGGLQTSYGFGGSVSYQFSDRVSMTLFGSYYTPLGGMTPAMMGYTSIPNFGGYVNYQFADRWGVKVGAQAFRSAMTNRIEAQPMVIPYYKLSKNAEIGVDVGGILYNIIKSNTGHGHRMNPTIPPPVGGPPPVAPRR